MQNDNRKILVRTWTGHAFDILHPQEGDIRIKDVAHHLSLQNRFIGATDRGYCTAQHSIYVMQMLTWLLGGHRLPTELLLQVLLHDSEEAYTGDFITPIKRDRYAGGPLQEIGNHLRGDIFQAFGLSRNMTGMIKTADSLVCAAEVRDMMHMDPREWGLPEPRTPDKIVPWSATFSEQRFLGEFNLLMNELQQERALQPARSLT